MLGIPESRVRERAREALVQLAPVSVRGVEEDWRGQLADYVLGQQAGPEVTATRGHLRRSEAARSWTRSLLDSLEQLYPNGDLPAIPDGERGSRRAAATPPRRRRRRRRARARAARPQRRWRRCGAGGSSLPQPAWSCCCWRCWCGRSSVLTGGDDSGKARLRRPAPAARSPRSARARRSSPSPRARPRSSCRPRGSRRARRRRAYQVWLYDSNSKRKSLGATATDKKGNLQVVGTCRRTTRTGSTSTSPRSR